MKFIIVNGKKHEKLMEKDFVLRKLLINSFFYITVWCVWLLAQDQQQPLWFSPWVRLRFYLFPKFVVTFGNRSWCMSNFKKVMFISVCNIHQRLSQNLQKNTFYLSLNIQYKNEGFFISHKIFVKDEKYLNAAVDNYYYSTSG